MSLDARFQGSLFATDFLGESVAETAEWRALDDAALDALDTALRTIFERFPIAGSPNESQTEDDLIWPVLALLGWAASLRQQNLSAHGPRVTPEWDEDEEQYNEILKRIAPTTNDLMMVPT